MTAKRGGTAIPVGVITAGGQELSSSGSPDAPETREFNNPDDWAALRDYVDSTFGEGFRNSDFVFRGEPSCYPSVLPLLDRIIPKETGMGLRIEAERVAMERFRQHGAMHVDDIQQSMLFEGLGAQTVMRHYGAPTRLVDWTTSPWVGLWFACVDAGERTPEAPGRLLAFNREQLTRVVHERFRDQTDACIRAAGPLPKVLTQEFLESASDWAVCFHCVGAMFPRLVAQQGLFTVASKPWLDHWEQISGHCAGGCYELHIGPSLKPTVLRRLGMMGVTSASLFPGVEGVARATTHYVRQYYGPQV